MDKSCEGPPPLVLGLLGSEFLEGEIKSRQMEFNNEKRVDSEETLNPR
jgi:hypothetical protein